MTCRNDVGFSNRKKNERYPFAVVQGRSREWQKKNSVTLLKDVITNSSIITPITIAANYS